MRPTINLRLDPEQILPVGGVTGGVIIFAHIALRLKLRAQWYRANTVICLQSSVWQIKKPVFGKMVLACRSANSVLDMHFEHASLLFRPAK